MNNFNLKDICKGEILTEKQGEKGFSYDHVFKPNGLNNSFEEMKTEKKNSISHRGNAVQKLVRFLIKNKT